MGSGTFWVTGMIALWLMITIGLTALASCTALTRLVRRYVLREGILDVPNGRSSHSIVTPRGGGLAIAIIFLGGTLILGLLQVVPASVAVALIGGGTVVAAVGWIDDKRGLSARQRAVTHFLAALWAVTMLGGFPSMSVGTLRVGLGIFGHVGAVVGIVWLTNLYNFMDGIDGLAAGEAAIVGLAAGVLLLAQGHANLASISWLLAGCTGGFLVWNWAPARIFMGDVSSGLIGFAFGVLAIASENAGAVTLLVWVLLLLAFIVDATATLIRRIVNGETWYAAHRTHAYQLAVAGGLSHQSVTTAVMSIDLLLAFLAYAAWRNEAMQPSAFLMGVGICLLVWVRTVRRFLPRLASRRTAGRGFPGGIHDSH